MRAMKSLCQKVAAQKLLIMQSLENDCSKEEINVQIAVSSKFQLLVEVGVNFRVIASLGT